MPTWDKLLPTRAAEPLTWSRIGTVVPAPYRSGSNGPQASRSLPRCARGMRGATDRRDALPQQR